MMSRIICANSSWPAAGCVFSAISASSGSPISAAYQSENSFLCVAPATMTTSCQAQILLQDPPSAAVAVRLPVREQLPTSRVIVAHDQPTLRLVVVHAILAGQGLNKRRQCRVPPHVVAVPDAALHLRNVHETAASDNGLPAPSVNSCTSQQPFVRGEYY